MCASDQSRPDGKRRGRKRIVLKPRIQRTIKQGGTVERARAHPQTLAAVSRICGVDRNVTVSRRETRHNFVAKVETIRTLRFQANPFRFRTARSPRHEQPTLPQALRDLGVRIETANQSLEMCCICARTVRLTAGGNHPMPIGAESTMADVSTRLSCCGV